MRNVGGGGCEKIKYWHGSVLPIQLGILQSKSLNVGIMFTKFSIEIGIKWPYHFSKIWFHENHDSYIWAGCKTLVVCLVSMVAESKSVK